MTSAKGLSSIRDILYSPFSAHGFAKVAKGLSICKIWQRAVGPNIAKKTLPLKLTGKTLYVTVATSTWMEELKYLKKDIIKKINNDLKEQTVEEIVFRLGAIAENNTSKNQPSAISHQTSEHQLSQKEIDDIDRMLKPIKDVELKETMKNAMVNKRKQNLNTIINR